MAPEASNMSEDSTTSSNVTGGKSEDVEGSVKVLKLIVAIVVTLLIICNNTINMMVLTKMRDINKRMKILLFSLSISDFCLGIMVCLPGVVSGILGYWPFSVVACQVTGTMNGVAIAVSLWSLMAISIERWVLIKKVGPVRNDKTIFPLILGVVFIWTFNVTFFALPIFLEDDFIYYSYDPAVISCSFRWKSTAYFIIAKFIYPVLSGTVILVSNIRIHYILREAQSFRKNLVSRMENSAGQSPVTMPSLVIKKREAKENGAKEIRGVNMDDNHKENDTSTRNLRSCKVYNVQDENASGPSRSKDTLYVEYTDTLESQNGASRHPENAISGRTVSPATHPTNKTVNSHSLMPRSTLRRNLKARLLLVCTAAVFFLTTSPYMISSLIDHFLVQWESSNSMKFAALWILNTNSFINVYVYSIIYREFRNHCRNLLSVLICSSHEGDSNRCHPRNGGSTSSARLKKTTHLTKHPSYPVSDGTVCKCFKANLDVPSKDRRGCSSEIKSNMDSDQTNIDCSHVIQVEHKERPALVPRNDAGVSCKWLLESDISANNHNNTPSNSKDTPLIAITSFQINTLPSIDV